MNVPPKIWVGLAWLAIIAIPFWLVLLWWLGIVWVMVTKPGWAGGIAALAIAYAVGTAAAIALTSIPAARAKAVTESAA